MYCTAGVRCERASAFMRNKGIENVFQLEGGVCRVPYTMLCCAEICYAVLHCGVRCSGAPYFAVEQFSLMQALQSATVLIVSNKREASATLSINSASFILILISPSQSITSCCISHLSNALYTLLPLLSHYCTGVHRYLDAFPEDGGYW